MVLSDFEAADDEEFLDFLVDEEEENLLVLSNIGGTKLEIKQYELNIQSVSSKISNIIFSKYLTSISGIENQKCKIYFNYFLKI